MKKLLTLVTFCLLGVVQSGWSQSATRKDSVIVVFGNKTKMVIYSEDPNGVKDLQKYDLNKILKDVGASMNLVDSKETYLYINDSTGRRYLTDTLAREFEKRKSKKTVSVEINKTNEADADDGASEEQDNDEDDKEDKEDDNHESRLFKHSGFDFDLGLNNYLEKGKFPSREGSPYGLRPWGSRYVAIRYLYKTRIGGEKSPFYLRYGIELSWNNFMFDGNNIAVRGDNTVGFPEAKDTELGVSELSKSKLTVSYLSIPVVPTLQFRDHKGRKTFRVGMGGYIGYRIGSHTKVKYRYEGETMKDKDYSSFYLNNFRYGLMAQVGVKNLVLFAKYDLNPLFADNKGPDLNAISFGITIL